ncbi:MAG: DUF3341 domain-containing protein [Acidobacteriaceae bacterium]
MAERHVAVYGIYLSDDLAESAANHLISRGFENSAISILLPDSEVTRTFAHEKHTKAAQGAVAGGIIGALIGGAFSLVVGLGALFVAGLGPLAAAGPVIACLTGVGSGGFVGGVIGAIVGATIPEYVARQHEGVKRSGPLLSVYCEISDQVAIARQAMRETGARSISVLGDDRPPHTQTAHNVA